MREAISLRLSVFVTSEKGNLKRWSYLSLVRQIILPVCPQS